MGKRGGLNPLDFGFNTIGASLGGIVTAPLKSILGALEQPMIILVVVVGVGGVIYIVVQ